MSELFDCRDAFAAALVELAAADPRIVALVNDSVGSTKLQPFQKRFPEIVKDVFTSKGHDATVVRYGPGSEEFFIYGKNMSQEAMEKCMLEFMKKLSEPFLVRMEVAELKKTKLGFISSVLYKNDWDAIDSTVKDYTASEGASGETELTVANQYDFYDVANTITLGGILALGVDLGEGQSIMSNTIIDRITDNQY